MILSLDGGGHVAMTHDRCLHGQRLKLVDGRKKTKGVGLAGLDDPVMEGG